MRNPKSTIGMVTATSLSLIITTFPATTHAQLCNPIETDKLTVPYGVDGENFGNALAISGDLAVIGEQFNFDDASDSGAAYIMRFDGANWVLEAKLQAYDAQAYDQFGFDVAISGNTVLIGTPYDDDQGKNAGSAYIFRYTGFKWVQVTKLQPADVAEDDRFGTAVALLGDTAFIGSPMDDDRGVRAGAVYVFKYNGSDWVEHHKIQPPDLEEGEDYFFGMALAATRFTLIVGAQGDDESSKNSGTAFVFRNDGSEWVKHAKLKASDREPGDSFGSAIALTDNSAIIAASYDRDHGEYTGSAYVFRRTNEQWVEEAKLTASDGHRRQFFGRSVAILDDNVVVGAPGDEVNGYKAGAAYFYHFDGFNWNQNAIRRPSDGMKTDYFGSAAALIRDTALIGASGYTDSAINPGAAYVFDLNCPQQTCLQLNVQNLVANQNATFTIIGGERGYLGITVYGLRAGNTTVKNYADFCATFGIKDLNQNKTIGPTNKHFDADGQITFDINIPAHLTGQHLFFQSAQQGTCPDECTSNLLELVVQ